MKKQNSILIFLLLSLVLIFGFTACGGGENAPVALSAPEISLSNNVISWSAVDNADSYEVYENGSKVKSQTETTYTITQSVPGTYSYTVKATSNDSNYTKSPSSNAVEYTASAIQLAAPVIRLSNDVIEWTAIAHADLYEVYEGETVVSRQANTTYKIVKSAAGNYTFKVKALSISGYTESNFSNAVTYTYNPQPVDTTQLDAPSISINSQTGVITWTAVPNATGYAVYENGFITANVTGTSYTITQTKMGTYSYYVSALSNKTGYSESDPSNTVTFEVGPQVLPAPHIELEGNVISWTAVAHANGYEVYEGNRRVAVTTELNYTITQTEYGSYEYTVAAMPESVEYAQSPRSNAVTYNLLPPAEPLATPQPSIDTVSRTINWTAIPNATAYEIYEDGVLVATQAETSYVITRLTPATYSYTVRAISDNAAYGPSEQSQPVEYTVTATSVVYEINVVFPEGYSGTETVTVGLYNDDGELIASGSATRDEQSNSAMAEIQAESGIYLAKLTTLPQGYLATQIHVNADTDNAVIRLVANNGDVFLVGSNSFSVLVAPGKDESNEQNFVFIAGKGGVYTIDASAERKTVTIFVNTNIVVDTSQHMSIGQFVAEEGELVLIDVAADQVGTYSFNITEGEVKQNIVIGDGDINQTGYANYITNGIASCTRYITLKERTSLVFFFTTPTIGLQIVTLTINGVQYQFDGNENNMQVITINAGTDIKIDITVDNIGNGGRESNAIAFFVYPQKPQK